MRNPDRIRALVVSDMIRACQALRVHLGYPDPDPAVLVHLEGEKVFDLAEELARQLMARLEGAQPAPVSRFDKVKRAMKKRRGRPPRGLKVAGEPTEADALPEGST